MVKEYLHEGKRLSEAREELGLSRSELAESLGQSERSIQQWEKGHNIPSGKSLMEYAKLGVSPTWILTGKGSPFLKTQAETELPIPEFRFFRDQNEPDYEEVTKISSLNFPEHTFLFCVLDDKMSATYPKGGKVFVEPFHDGMVLEGPILFWLNHQPTIRWAQPLIGKGIHISCESPSIPDEVIQMDKLEMKFIIGKVIGYINYHEAHSFIG